MAKDALAERCLRKYEKMHRLNSKQSGVCPRVSDVLPTYQDCYWWPGLFGNADPHKMCSLK